jgi:outer membrane immunogenic protein
MRIAVLFVALFIGSSALAIAADLPAGPLPPAAPIYAPPPPAPYNWTSIYVGANAGYGSALASITATGALTGTTSETVSGFVGGGQVGANYQLGWAVIGIEGDFDGSAQSLTTSAPGFTETDQIPWMGTLRLRAGFAVDRFLVYATGGGGMGEFSSTVTVAGIGTASASTTRGLVAVGGGVEVGIAHNWTARVEYLYLDSGNVALASVAGVNVTGRVQDNVVRAGLNFRIPLGP